MIEATPRVLRLAAAAAAALLVAACATRPVRDGPEANPPGNLDRVADPEPRVEQPRAGGPNKPYDVGGTSYTPLTGDPPLRESGLASWYGRKFHGRPTASGEPYDMYAMTAAHKTMPIPSYARVRNPANGREIIVRVNDRGPFAAGRIIDLSYTAALRLGVLGGVAPVVVERITNAEIRAGLVRRAAPPDAPGGDALDAIGDDSVGAAPAPGWWLQLGAFRQRDSALDLQRRAQADVPSVVVASDGDLHRVQVGPYVSRTEALNAADRLRRLLALTPLLLERTAGP